MNRDAIIALVIKLEGGYVNDPRDPGGATNMGVTQRYLDNARKSRPELPASVRDLTVAQVTSLYAADQWVKIHGDALHPPVAALAFDSAVNNGPGTAVGLLKAALASGAADLAAEYAAQRAAYYARLGKPEFTLGWMRRLFSVYTASLKP